MQVSTFDSEGMPTRRAMVVARIARVFDYVFGLLYSLLLVRLALDFFKARQNTGFYEFIRDVTAPFFAPFDHIVATNAVDGSPVVWPLVVAIIAYMLLHACIRGLLRLIARG